jgi:hypothetical protein
MLCLVRQKNLKVAKVIKLNLGVAMQRVCVLRNASHFTGGHCVMSHLPTLSVSGICFTFCLLRTYPKTGIREIIGVQKSNLVVFQFVRNGVSARPPLDNLDQELEHVLEICGLSWSKRNAADGGRNLCVLSQ